MVWPTKNLVKNMKKSLTTKYLNSSTSLKIFHQWKYILVETTGKIEYSIVPWWKRKEIEKASKVFCPPFSFHYEVSHSLSHPLKLINQASGQLILNIYEEKKKEEKITESMRMRLSMNLWVRLMNFGWGWDIVSQNY